MSHIVVNAPVSTPAWLSAVLDWFRHARIAIRLARHDIAHQSVENLSDRQLCDIGAERRDVARAVDREMGRLGLLDIGWQKPGRRLGE